MFASCGHRGEKGSLQLPAQGGLPAWLGAVLRRAHSIINSSLRVCPKLDTRSWS